MNVPLGLQLVNAKLAPTCFLKKYNTSSNDILRSRFGPWI